MDPGSSSQTGSRIKHHEISDLSFSHRDQDTESDDDYDDVDM